MMEGKETSQLAVQKVKKGPLEKSEALAPRAGRNSTGLLYGWVKRTGGGGGGERGREEDNVCVCVCVYV